MECFLFGAAEQRHSLGRRLAKTNTREKTHLHPERGLRADAAKLAGLYPTARRRSCCDEILEVSQPR